MITEIAYSQTVENEIEIFCTIMTLISIHIVYTNPGKWMEGEEEGRLWIEPYHHQTTCDLSTVNLCKVGF